MKRISLGQPALKLVGLRCTTMKHRTEFEIVEEGTRISSARCVGGSKNKGDRHAVSYSGVGWYPRALRWWIRDLSSGALTIDPEEAAEARVRLFVGVSGFCLCRRAAISR